MQLSHYIYSVNTTMRSGHAARFNAHTFTQSGVSNWKTSPSRDPRLYVTRQYPVESYGQPDGGYRAASFRP